MARRGWRQFTSRRPDLGSRSHWRRDQQEPSPDSLPPGKGASPAKKIGGRWCSSRSALRAFFASQFATTEAV